MDIKEIRIVNLQKILKSLGLNKNQLADKVNTNPAYLSQILNPKHRAQIGDDLARRIEEACELPHGWMDRLHDDHETNIAEQRLEYQELESQLTQEEREHMNDLMRLVIEKRKILKKLL